MSSRDFGFVALGRFLVVERYRETCLTSPAGQVRRPGRLDTPGSSSGSRAPDRPRQR